MVSKVNDPTTWRLAAASSGRPTLLGAHLRRLRHRQYLGDHRTTVRLAYL